MDSSRYMALRGMGTATMRITESERGVRIELTVRMRHERRPGNGVSCDG